jgi:glycine dehydrogenase
MQRFGLPLGFGGPHAAYLAARADLVRFLPGRIVGVSKDSAGRTAYRLALQTREQHIRRERALSNICTAQVLPAIAASFYAIYHGPSGLIRIANRIAELAGLLHSGLCELGLVPATTILFDTLRIPLGTQERARTISAAERFNIELNTRYKDAVSVTLGETHSQDDVADLLRVFAFAVDRAVPDLATIESSGLRLPKELRRTTPILEQEVFHRYHSEHELLRYMKKLENRDLSLTTSMIPLGSCTMKLNATAEMLPMTWHEIASMHPYTAQRNAVGIIEVARELSSWLAEVTGMDAVSLQPNSGAQGEYAGLLAIRAYHEKRQDSRRTICLVPTSAHGTNPASAVLAGLQVVTVACDSRGNVDLDDLHTKIAQHQNQLAAIMITYPSTHGVFESSIRDVCDAIHSAGGLVYLDGANLNAQVGLCRPGDFGADVCHINLHKTFCIPHGGGGPGMGPIAVRDLLADYLPGHRDFTRNDDVIADDSHIRMVSAAPYGSGSLLPISWMYIRMMGAQGLRRATQQALLNANYMAYRLSQQYAVLFRGSNGFCAHEFIIDLRAFKKTASIEVDDVAKRLMDYGFHAPTVSFPVPGTLMIEPTESESLSELDRFCDALLAIREEIREIELGQASPHDNVLKGAPHTAHVVCADAWSHPYTRERAAYPSPHTRDQKFWPSVGRVDAAAGDRHLVCTRELPASL